MRISLAVILAVSSLPLAAQAQDASAWQGINLGFTANTVMNGSQDYFDPFGPYDIKGSAQGAFVGYTWASGAMAYGVELSYAKADYNQAEADGSADYQDYKFNHTLDLKARVGYAFGKALAYGVVGYGQSEWEDGPGGVYDGKGLIYGVGLDYLVSDRVFVGGEVLRRTMDSDGLFVADVTTLSLRVGMKF